MCMLGGRGTSAWEEVYMCMLDVMCMFQGAGGQRGREGREEGQLLEWLQL